MGLFRDAVDLWYTFPLAYKLIHNILVLLVTFLLPQLKDGYLCFVVCVNTTTIFLQGFWGGHRKEFWRRFIPPWGNNPLHVRAA